MSFRSSAVLIFALILLLCASAAQAYVADPPGGGGGGDTNPYPKTYAILIGSQSPSEGVADALRGDFDVDKVNAQLQPWATEVYTFKYNWADNDKSVGSDIFSAANSIAAVIQPGDSLIFYYSGHGIGGSDYDEQDFLKPMLNSEFQDNDLAIAFAGSAYTKVNKFFLIDCCHSQGMWKNDSEFDADLEMLPKISFLGSSSEDGDAYYNSETGSYFTNAILSSLQPSSTFDNLVTSAMLASGTNATGYTKGDGSDLKTWQAVRFTSSDFNANATLGTPVPEPATLLMLFSGVVIFVGCRRYRKI
jgi:hypothetical protein